MGKCCRKLNWAVKFEVLTTISMRISPTVFLDVTEYSLVHIHQAARQFMKTAMFFILRREELNVG
jgi:hypothetical protein